MKRAQGTRVHRSFSEGGGQRAQGKVQSILFLLVILSAGVIFSSGCSKDDFPVTENQDAFGEIQLNTLFNITEISDGFIVSGICDSKIKILKLDVNFNTVWSKDDFEWGNIFPGSGWGSTFYSADIINVIEKGNGSLVFFCSIIEGGCVVSSSALIVVLDRSGKEISKKELENYALINSVMTRDGGFLLFGSSLIRLNSNLSKVNEYEDQNYVFSGANTIQTDDNGFAISGTMNSQQVLLQKLDENGIVQWEKSNFNANPFNDLGCDLHQLSDNGFLIAGRTRNTDEPWDMNCFIIRTESSGDTIWTRKYGEGLDEWFEEILYASDDGFIIRKTVGFPNDVEQKAFLTGISGNGNIIPESVEININDNFLWTSSGYFVKAEKTGDSFITLSKVQIQNLFDNLITYSNP